MYRGFFGLRERPFDLTPNPRFLMLTGTHGEALANLQCGMTARKGLTLLVGDAGVGKTTLLRSALQQWSDSGYLIAHLNNPTLTRDEFIEYLTASFGLDPEAAASKTRFLAALTALLTDRHERDLITGLVIDEAQSLSTELLEEIRLLVNIETTTAKMLQVMLVAQPEIVTRLNEPCLRQLKQRVALRCVLSTLSCRETAAYIAGRIQVAGGMAAQIFTREAVRAVHEHAGGVPRIISVICDNALLAAFAGGIRPVTRDVVEEVCRDFDYPLRDIADDDGEKAVNGIDLRDDVRPADGRPRPVRAVTEPAAAAGGAPVLAAPSAAGERHVYPGLFDALMARQRRRFSFF